MLSFSDYISGGGNSTSVSKSVTKFDIINLENKIKGLENKITSIKGEHDTYT